MTALRTTLRENADQAEMGSKVARVLGPPEQKRFGAKEAVYSDPGFGKAMYQLTPAAKATRRSARLGQCNSAPFCGEPNPSLNE